MIEPKHMDAALFISTFLSQIHRFSRRRAQ